MQYDLEAGKLLLHCPALPQEGVSSAFTLSSCQVHTELLPNPVCHISGGKKGEPDRRLQHFPEVLFEQRLDSCLA